MNIKRTYIGVTFAAALILSFITVNKPARADSLGGIGNPTNLVGGGVSILVTHLRRRNRCGHGTVVVAGPSGTAQSQHIAVDNNGSCAAQGGTCQLVGGHSWCMCGNIHLPHGQQCMQHSTTAPAN